MTQQDLNFHYHKVAKPSEDVCKPLRHIIVAVVLESKDKPLHVNEIRRRVQQRIAELSKIGHWTHGYVGHNTVERRINECADPRHWDGLAPLVHVGDPKSPFYGLNPSRFPELKENKQV